MPGLGRASLAPIGRGGDSSPSLAPEKSTPLCTRQRRRRLNTTIDLSIHQHSADPPWCHSSDCLDDDDTALPRRTTTTTTTTTTTADDESPKSPPTSFPPEDYLNP